MRRRNTDPDGNRNGYCNGNSDTNSYAHRDGNCNCNRYADRHRNTSTYAGFRPRFEPGLRRRRRTTGTYQADYIEIKNISGVAKSLGGLSVVYGAAAGQFASSGSNTFALANVTLQPGQYYLVQLGTVGTGGVPIP